MPLTAAFFCPARYGALAGTPDWAMMDTNGDGKVDGGDDPLSPYYPGMLNALTASVTHARPRRQMAS